MDNTVSNASILTMLAVVTRLLRVTEKFPTAFSYALIVNQQRLQKLADLINQAIEHNTPEFVQIEQAWNSLRPQFALRNDVGQVIRDTVGQIVVNPARMTEYDAACKQMLRENPGWLDIYLERIAEIERVKALMVEFIPYTVSITQFPDRIAPSDLIDLQFMIDDKIL